MLVLMDWALFQSTSSVWRTTSDAPAGDETVDISIHVLRVEDDGFLQVNALVKGISIHVLRVEDDVKYVL